MAVTALQQSVSTGHFKQLFNATIRQSRGAGSNSCGDNEPGLVFQFHVRDLSRYTQLVKQRSKALLRLLSSTQRPRGQIKIGAYMFGRPFEPFSYLCDQHDNKCMQIDMLLTTNPQLCH